MRTRAYSTQPTPAANDVGTVLRALDDLGLADTVPEVRAARDLALALAERARQAPTDYRHLSNQLARQLADGTLDIDTAVDQIAEADRASARHGAAVELLRQASGIAHTRSAELLAATADDLLETVLAKHAEKVVATATKAAGKLPDWLTDDTEAVKAEKAIRDAWAQLTECAATWRQLTDLARHLRLRGFLTVPKIAEDAPRHLFEYRHPDLAPSFDPRHPPLPPLRLAADIAAGAEPALVTPAEVAARLEAEQARHDAEVRQRSTEGRRYQSIPSSPHLRAAVKDALARERTGATEFLPDAG